MDHHKTASVIKTIFSIVIFVLIAGAVWLYPKSDGKSGWFKEFMAMIYKPAEKPIPPATQSPEKGILIVFHFSPDEVESTQMGEVYDSFQKKYESRVIISRVNSKLNPEISKEQGVTKPPHAIIIAGTEKVHEFLGLQHKAAVHQKLEEILRGLERMTKDWRPKVKGMTPQGAQ
jgi:hypothetical protein